MIGERAAAAPERGAKTRGDIGRLGKTLHVEISNMMTII